jgi:hypothetical protein
MENLWDLVDTFFLGWNSRETEGDAVTFGDYSYPKNLEEKDLARNLLLDINPELKCVFNPDAASYIAASSVAGKEYDPKLVEKMEPLVKFDPFSIIQLLGEMGLTKYEQGLMVIKKDDKKLPEFYHYLYYHIFPKDVDPSLGYKLSMEQLREAYNFLKDEGFVKLRLSADIIRKRLVDNKSNADQLVENDTDFSRYQKYGVFGEGWKEEVRKIRSEQKAGKARTDLLASKIYDELIKHAFWAKTYEDEYLKDNEIDLDKFSERKKNEGTYNVLWFLRYMGISWLKEDMETFGDAPVVTSNLSCKHLALPVIPNEDQYRKRWAEAYDKGHFGSYVDLVAPRPIFPHLNNLFNNLFEEIRQDMTHTS